MILQTRDVPPRVAFALEQAGVHPLLARLFASRGIGSAAELGNHLLGQAQLGHRALQCRHGLVGAVALSDVEGDVLAFDAQVQRQLVLCRR